MSARTFVIPFYYGFGSGTVINYGSGPATLLPMIGGGWGGGRVQRVPKKVDTSGPTQPLQAARELEFPPSKSIRPAHIKNRYTGHFMDKRFQGPFRNGFT